MTTIRVRLTLIYSGVFVLTSILLLTLVNLTVGQTLQDRIGPYANAPDAPPAPGAPMLLPRPVALPTLVDDVLAHQWEVTVPILGITALVAVVVGWVLAGRILRPIHRITATARRLSASNLHERIMLSGPKDELRELADTFDAMLGRLERSVEGQRRFIANASHELRTPLAVQRAAIEIGLPEDVGEVRERLLVHNHRMERLIESLLILARAGHGLDVREPVAVDQVVRRVLAETKADGIAVTERVEPFVVDGDEVLLHRLVTNLVDNAVRYNRPGGTVEVSLLDGVLTVRNTGSEVPEERLGDLFQPFRRLHTTREQGSGLGLSIVASIAEAHGAGVDAEPNPGGGLRLVVTFRDLGTAPAAGRAAGAVRHGVRPRYR
ncbi:sensor histidine kinase [Acrocarpospora catenulata]|uniref:sensor histidine kinase n=1 Tax=Acrocarpospora catenulata TaxID=2836182 RepID=UPI001BDA714D|nr:ATP-binding protein [Acrocarpospora catenulata]